MCYRKVPLPTIYLERIFYLFNKIPSNMDEKPLKVITNKILSTQMKNSDIL